MVGCRGAGGAGFPGGRAQPLFLPRDVSCPGRVQSQVGEGLEQPDLVVGVPAHGRGTWVPMIFKVKTKPSNT